MGFIKKIKWFFMQPRSYSIIMKSQKKQTDIIVARNGFRFDIIKRRRGRVYYYITWFGEYPTVRCAEETFDSTDNLNFKAGNYYSSSKFAKGVKKKLEIFLRDIGVS